MNKIILILSLAMIPITFMAQSGKQPDSLLIYSFSQNGDSTLGVLDVRTYNSEGLLQTRTQIVYENSIISRNKGNYNGNYSYTETENEKITTITYLANNGDTTETENIYYKNDEITYLQQSLFYYNGNYGLHDYRKRIYKGIKNYTYTHLFEEATGYAMSIYDNSELPLYHADTILIERLTNINSNIWDTGVYVFHYNPDNSVERVIYTNNYRTNEGKNEYIFIYDTDNRCVKIEYFRDIIINADSIVSVKDYEITQTLNENNQPLVVTYFTMDNEYDPFVFNHKFIYNYDNEGNLLLKSVNRISDISDMGYLVEKSYYIYNSPSSIQEYNLNSISIFPNPAQSQFTVTNTENATISLYNILGQKIKQVTGTEENTIIQTSDLPAGIYVLKVEKGNAVITKKVQIMK
jgi:hypothetical protein